jgi:hypothetical protein
LEGCIENFLGIEILNHPVVRNLKLSENERLRLDGPISEFELETALEGANLKSAAGIDGINTAFIKRYWYIFKAPLLKKRFLRKKHSRKALKRQLLSLYLKKGTVGTLKNGVQYRSLTVCTKYSLGW